MKFKTALSISIFAGTAAALVSCAAKQTGSTETLPPFQQRTSSLGLFQGPVMSPSGTVEALLNMTIQKSADGTTAVIAMGSASIVVPVTDGVLAVDLPAKTYGDDARVSISAQWNGQAWVGSMSAGSLSTDATRANSFQLTTQPTDVKASAVGAPNGQYDGVLKYSSSGGTRVVSLVISQSPDIGDQLASTLTTHVALSAYLKYSNGQKESLKNVVWNRDTSTLTATGSVNTPTGLLDLSCKMSEATTDDKETLRCAETTSKSDAPVATGALSQKRAQVPPYPGPPTQQPPVPQPVPPVNPTPYQPPAPAPAPAPTAAPIPAPTAIPVPVPTPSFAVSKNVRNYEGTAIFTNDQGQKTTRSVTMTVTLETAPTGADQKARAKILLDKTRVSANFPQGSFNSGTGVLTATLQQIFGSLAGTLDMSCTGLSFDNPNYDFQCHYESSVTNVVGDFHFAAGKN